MFGVYLGVRTCEVFLCFVTIMMFVLSIVLTSTSLVNVTGSYTEDEPMFEHLRGFVRSGSWMPVEKMSTSLADVTSFTACI